MAVRPWHEFATLCPLTLLSSNTACQPSAITQNSIFYSRGTLNPGARLPLVPQPHLRPDAVVLSCIQLHGYASGRG